MLQVTLVLEVGRGRGTARLCGAALCTEAAETRRALGEALSRCEELAIDVGRVRALDASFPALICALHRQSHLSRKKITLKGSLPRRGAPLPYAGIADCLFKRPHESCPLWEPVLQPL